MAANKKESEESERAVSVQHQVQLLRLKEREIADVSSPHPPKSYCKPITKKMMSVKCHLICLLQYLMYNTYGMCFLGSTSSIKREKRS